MLYQGAWRPGGFSGGANGGPQAGQAEPGRAEQARYVSYVLTR